MASSIQTSQRPAEASRPSPGTQGSPGLWLALVVGLSPVLAELAGHAWLRFWARPTFLFYPLFALALAREFARGDALRTAPRTRSGRALLGLALALFVGGYAGGLPTVARLALPLSAFGVGLLVGRPPLGALLLAAWLIPLPSAVVSLLSPGLESGFAALARGLLGPLCDLTGTASLLVAGGERFALEAGDGGVALASTLVGLVVFAQVWRAEPLRWPRLLGAALSALPLQALAVVVAGLLVAFQGAEAARFFLHALWLPIAALLATLWLLSPVSAVSRPAHPSA